MIEIRHKVSRAVLLRASVDTLNGKNLTGHDLTSADLSERSMCYTCFCRTTLRLADLSGALLSNAVMDSANLELANLSKADLASASLLGAQLRGANLTAATMRYAQLTGADMQGANLEKADLSMADVRADLRDAILIHADLRGANLAGANLKGANLTGADLTSANLEGASMLGAKLQGAKLDRGMQASLRAVIAAPTMFSRRVERQPEKPPLALDFGSVGMHAPRRPSEARPVAEPDPRHAHPHPAAKPIGNGGESGANGRSNGQARSTADGADSHRLDKWKSILRVRYLGGQHQKSLPIKIGSEGIVMEFLGPLGNIYWQVQFPEVGSVYVHRQDLEVLDHDFLEDAGKEQQSEADKLLQGVKETVLYSTNNGKFKSLVIWYSENRYIAVEESRKAEMLIQLCKLRRIRVTRDRWFD